MAGDTQHKLAVQDLLANVRSLLDTVERMGERLDGQSPPSPSRESVRDSGFAANGDALAASEVSTVSSIPPSSKFPSPADEENKWESIVSPLSLPDSNTLDGMSGETFTPYGSEDSRPSSPTSELLGLTTQPYPPSGRLQSLTPVAMQRSDCRTEKGELRASCYALGLGAPDRCGSDGFPSPRSCASCSSTKPVYRVPVYSPRSTEQLCYPVISEPDMASPREGSPETSTMHDRFYFSDGNVSFLTENTVFRVHRYFFERDSEYFRHLFVEQTNIDLRAVSLKGITIKDFERFLGVLYPRQFDQHDASTVEDWTSILALATLWSFASIRALAIRELFPITSPIDRIVLGNACEVYEWLKDAYLHVCLRSEGLSFEEGERLGMDKVIRVFQIREELRRCDCAVDEREALRLIERAFGLSQDPGNGRNVEDGRTTLTPSEGTTKRGSQVYSCERAPQVAAPVVGHRRQHSAPGAPSTLRSSSSSKHRSHSSASGYGCNAPPGPLTVNIPRIVTPLVGEQSLSTGSTGTSDDGPNTPWGQKHDVPVSAPPRPDTMYFLTPSPTPSLPVRAPLSRSGTPLGHLPVGPADAKEQSRMSTTHRRDERSSPGAAKRPAGCRCSWQLCAPCRMREGPGGGVVSAGPLWTLDWRIVRTTADCTCRWQKCAVCEDGNMCPYCAVIES